MRRLGVVYHPNGVIYDQWLPTGVGTEFKLSPTLAGLEPFRDKLIVVTGLYSDAAEALGDGGGDHSRASGTYLTGVHVKKSDSVVENGISMDQIAAKAFERDTQLSSLQLTVDDNSLVGSCDLGYSCAYSSTLSWLTPTLPLMAENNPRVVFERMFGSSDSTDPRVRAARLQQDRSMLDSVNDRVNQLQQKLGRADNRKVDDYLTSLRDVERRIQKAEEQSAKEMPEVAQPAGIPDKFEQHVELLYDLQLLAYQSDLTRVITFMYGREQTGRPVSADRRPGTAPSRDASSERPGEDGEVHAHSALSHRACSPTIWRSCKNTPDGDGSLLDHTILLYGGGISNSDRHTHGPLPTLLGWARDAQGRPSPGLSGTHAVDEPAADAAEQAGGSGREARRQQRTVHGTIRAVTSRRSPAPPASSPTRDSAGAQDRACSPETPPPFLPWDRPRTWCPAPRST